LFKGTKHSFSIEQNAQFHVTKVGKFIAIGLPPSSLLNFYMWLEFSKF
jgi:hypothetical protein